MLLREFPPPPPEVPGGGSRVIKQIKQINHAYVRVICTVFFYAAGVERLSLFSGLDSRERFRKSDQNEPYGNVRSLVSTFVDIQIVG